MRPLIDPDAVGAVIDGTVIGKDAGSGLVRVQVGDGELKVQATGSPGFAPGSTLRVQLLARDIIVSTQLPQHLSVRNNLKGAVAAVEDDGPNSDLVTIDIGGAQILARVTKAATQELALAPGLPAWALVKSVSLRAYERPTSPVFPRA